MLEYYLLVVQEVVVDIGVVLVMFDESCLQELFGEDIVLVGQMLDMFVEYIMLVMDELVWYCQVSDLLLGEIQVLGYWLVGSCLNLGIQVLGQVGCNMELVVCQGELVYVCKFVEECVSVFVVL